jgi:hypothetical protein
MNNIRRTKSTFSSYKDRSLYILPNNFVPSQRLNIASTLTPYYSPTPSQRQNRIKPPKMLGKVALEEAYETPAKADQSRDQAALYIAPQRSRPLSPPNKIHNRRAPPSLRGPWHRLHNRFPSRPRNPRDNLQTGGRIPRHRSKQLHRLSNLAVAASAPSPPSRCMTPFKQDRSSAAASRN